jgi:hypothetical protein
MVEVVVKPQLSWWWKKNKKERKNIKKDLVVVGWRCWGGCRGGGDTKEALRTLAVELQVLCFNTKLSGVERWRCAARVDVPLRPIGIVCMKELSSVRVDVSIQLAGFMCLS